ncbi:unnamed protein product [Ceutorhynchus assimilis]|uniref:Ig-like domain-containing protein n=1 Tax=Ceutorhynchus assimilis TaxID=467358 RepID=A0A9N9QJN6_9CUCU|nr:unnamed protein product [Ceutorhynchus assimilis]
MCKVVSEHYEVDVYHTHVIAGNTAVLTCVIPAVVEEHVTVTSWSRDESILLPGPNMGGRIIVTYGTGELLIRSARHDDSLPTYSCLTIHALTQERKRSQAARLTVIEVYRYDNLNLDFDSNPTAILHEMFAQFQKSYYHREQSEPCLYPINLEQDAPLVVIDCSRQGGDILKNSAVDIRVECETV